MREKKYQQTGLDPYLYKCTRCGEEAGILKESTMKLLAEIIKERDELRERLRVAGTKIKKVETCLNCEQLSKERDELKYSLEAINKHDVAKIQDDLAVVIGVLESEKRDHGEHSSSTRCELCSTLAKIKGEYE